MINTIGDGTCTFWIIVRPKLFASQIRWEILSISFKSVYNVEACMHMDYSHVTKLVGPTYSSRLFTVNSTVSSVWLTPLPLSNYMKSMQIWKVKNQHPFMMFTLMSPKETGVHSVGKHVSASQRIHHTLSAYYHYIPYHHQQNMFSYSHPLYSHWVLDLVAHHHGNL